MQGVHWFVVFPVRLWIKLKTSKEKCLNALTCRPPLTLNFVHISLHLRLIYNAYNSRIAQLIMLNKNVIWILMFSKKTVALNKIYIAERNRKLNNFLPFWDLTYTPEWFEFIDVGLTFLALKNCIAIRKTYCYKFRQA